MKFKLTIAFDGTAYDGWQSQKTGRGVQDLVQAALARLFASAPSLVSSSRTDAGVHAFGMIAHFEIEATEWKMPLRHLALAINACLPDDIRIRRAASVHPSFNARFDAMGKQYRYRVWNHPVMNPLLRQQAWHVPGRLNFDAMEQAAAHFIGRQDFRSFTANRGAILENSIRTVTRCEFRRCGSRVTFIIEGEGFLYKMCRAIAGTLIQIGEGRFTPEQVLEMLASKDRRRAGMNAPAQGLILWKVFYPKSGF